MTPKLLYAGFDSVYVALQGAFPVETIESLKAARERAAEARESLLVRIGPEGEAMHLAESGLRGGFAFRGDTGPLGEMLAFKANPGPGEWNGFASIHARTLATLGFDAAREQLLARLDRMGFTVHGHSVNRIDYAADFLAPGFVLRPQDFIAHARTKKLEHWSRPGLAKASDPNHPSAVLTGRHVQSVTIGKMPGRQVIVYDKRAEAVAKRNPFWFKRWGIDPADASAEVHRIEVRAGKQHLKERWHLSTLAEVDEAIGDVIRHALADIRYIASGQTDKNVTRLHLDPLWQAMIDHVEDGLSRYRAGLLPSDIKEVERECARGTYTALALGNIAGLAVAEGIDDEAIESDLPERIARLVRAAINDPRNKFLRSVDRTRERLHFILKDRQA
jgi:hypothetical protein